MTTTSIPAYLDTKGKRFVWNSLPFLLPIVIIGGYALYSWLAPSFFWPTVPQIALSFQENWLFARFPTDIVPSLVRMFTGFLLGSIVGTLVGLLAGLSRNFSVAIDPVVQFMRALPSPALIPLALIILGAGDASKLAIIFLGATWPVLLNAIDGVRSVHPTQIDTARSLRIPWFARIVHVILPAALPRIFAGMKTALALALILMVVTEMIASVNGIGFFVIQAQRQFDIPEMWAGIVLLGLLGYFLNLLFDRLERRILRWYDGMLGRPIKTRR